MNNSDDTVDAATQCGEETEASTQTEEMMNSLSQTVDMAGHEEEEVEEIGRIPDSWAGIRGTLHYNLLPPKQKLLRIKCVITRISGREHCFYSLQYGSQGAYSGISCPNIL